MIKKIIDTVRGLRDWARFLSALLVGINAFLDALEKDEKPSEPA